MTALPYGHVRLLCDDPTLDLTLRLGPDPLRITGGVGGWEITGRPLQVGMTTWGGVEPFQVTFGLMLDGLHSGASVEDLLRRVVRVGRGDAESPPGVLAVLGLSLPADEWVLEGLEFSDPILRADGQRVRQQLSLTLREYVPPSYLHLRRRALLGGAKGKTRVVKAKKGDTPAKIARREHCRWEQIRELNPQLVRKANQKLKTGTKLRVPVATRKDRKAKSRRGTSKAHR